MLFPSSFPGLEIPIVDSTMQGGLNSISIGYGSQYPCRPEEGVKNFTKLQVAEKSLKTSTAKQIHLNTEQSYESKPWDTPAFCKSGCVSEWGMRKIQEII